MERTTIGCECKPPDGEPPYAPIDELDGYDNEWAGGSCPCSRGGTRLGQLGGGLGGAALRASFTYYQDGQAEPEQATYEVATFENGVFDSGPVPLPVTIELVLGAHAILLPVQRLRVRFELTPSGKAIAGQLSGAVRVAAASGDRPHGPDPLPRSAPARGSTS